MSPRGQEADRTNVGVALPALMLFAFPLEILRVVAWMWVAAAAVMLLSLSMALAVRSLILPHTNPELHRLVTRTHR